MIDSREAPYGFGGVEEASGGTFASCGYGSSFESSSSSSSIHP